MHDNQAGASSYGIDPRASRLAVGVDGVGSDEHGIRLQRRHDCAPASASKQASVSCDVGHECEAHSFVRSFAHSPASVASQTVVWSGDPGTCCVALPLTWRDCCVRLSLSHSLCNNQSTDRSIVHWYLGCRVADDCMARRMSVSPSPQSSLGGRGVAYQAIETDSRCRQTARIFAQMGHVYVYTVQGSDRPSRTLSHTVSLAIASPCDVPNNVQHDQQLDRVVNQAQLPVVDLDDLDRRVREGTLEPADTVP